MKNEIMLVSRKIGQFTMNNAPTILTITASVGVVVTAMTTGKAAVKASRVLEELEYSSPEKPTMVMKAKKAAPYFIMPAFTATATILCIVGAHRIHIQREAAIAAAYTLMDSKYKEYKDKVISEIGEKKENRLHDEIAQDKITETYPQNGLNVIQTKYGNVLFMDSFSGRYFYSSYEHVEKAKIELTKIAQRDMSVSLNEFYNFLEIPSIDGGKLLGWNLCKIEDDTFKPIIPIVTNRTCKTPTPEQLPCTIIDYEIEPIIDYDKCF